MLQKSRVTGQLKSLVGWRISLQPAAETNLDDILAAASKFRASGCKVR